MGDTLLGRVGNFLHRRPWYELPRLLAMPRLIQIRNELRQKNLIDTEEPPLQREEVPPHPDPARRQERQVDGTYNDLTYPSMGACGRRFGRNVPLDHTFPDTANLFVPSPRIVSRELMTRREFQPASFVNLLAAAWIQFMVHDWFVHKQSSLADGYEIPLAPGDDWPHGPMRVSRTVPEPAPPGSTRPPAYANPNSHWWDASQVYGSTPEISRQLRTGEGGQLKIEPTRLLPVDPQTGLHFSGFTDNWWIGLAMLHILFTLEHNHIAALLAAEHRDWDDQQLYAKARLINSALMAKIHTIEWTPAILPNEVVTIAMNANWYGLKGRELQEVFEFLNESEILGGIVGSKANHHGAPYCLTEEFVAVYRMHPLIPDEIVFRSLATGGVLERRELPDMAGVHTPGVAQRIALQDLFYSFGIANPGAIRLHNYPRHLQNLQRDNGERFDLAAVDILRDRERGVPRYNQFRRLLHKPAVRSFEELTDNVDWQREMRAVYGGDIEQVDLMTGLYAEPLPDGFGFSDTAFRVFVLMASRRLKSDRFFTDDFTPEMYTELGLAYIDRNSMLTVLQRHVPELATTLAGVQNAFHPWTAVV
ncbi:MAG: peroxidase family protein [Vicinamibacterales bacterium]